MTPEEYVQLKAFARQDGALLSLLWIGSFACYIKGLTIPSLGLAAVLLAVASPFFAASRLRHFRDKVREGIISFRRGYAYSILLFFYAGILLAAAVWAYFALIDDGYLLGIISRTLHSAEGRQLMEAYGMGAQIDESLNMLAEMRPIDYAVNMLTVNITAGLLLGIPIAATMKRTGNESTHS